MNYELNEKEAQIVEKFRDLLPEFQTALGEQVKVLLDLQSKIIKELISQK